MMNVLHRRDDGTFVIERNGMPYHVTTDSPLFAAVAAAAEGVELPPEPVPETLALTVADYQRAVETHIDATAQTRGYSSAVSCASYIGSTNAEWAAEATAFVAWRDDVWEATLAALAAWHGGGEEPTIDGLIAELPAISWLA